MDGCLAEAKAKGKSGVCMLDAAAARFEKIKKGGTFCRLVRFFLCSLTREK